MAIVLIRHGETALNAARTVQPFDTPISDRGHEQAARLSRRIASEFSPVVILSSDAPRALQTATPLASALGRPVIPDPLLRERDFGALRGLPYDSLGFDPISMRQAPPGGESIERFESRVRQAWGVLTETQGAHAGGDVIVFSHGLWIRSALEQGFPTLQRPISEMVLANSSVTVIDCGPPLALVLGACVVHLGEGGSPKGIAGI